ncbi:MAG: hypothetical protein RIC56_02385 [Pseudomonadales bacterium]
MEQVCIAFKAHMGWVNTAAVARGDSGIRCLAVGRVDLVSGDDREVLEPYHVAGGWHGLERRPRPADPAAVVRRGRKRQVASACLALSGYQDSLRQRGLELTRAVLLTGRGRIGADLERLLGSHAQIHVAEGEAVRDALREALRALAVDRLEQDEKTVLARAATTLDESDPDAFLRSAPPPVRPPAGPWRKEERLLALAAWLHR